MENENTRRDFVKKAATGLLSLPLLGAQGLQFNPSTSPEELKFLLKEGLVYLNTGSLGPCPTWLLDRVSEIAKILESNPVSENWGPLGQEMEKVRSKAAQFLQCEVEEVVLTRNTTEGLSMISSNLELIEGEEILTTNHEHGGGEVGLDYQSRVSTAEVRQIELPFPALSKDQIIESVINQVNDRTRLLMLSHVSTITGLVMPLKEISENVQELDLFFLGDGAQACGMIDVNVSEFGVDAYATSGHKWMMGPKETGILYINGNAQERVKPVFLHSGYGSYSASSGTRNVAQMIAFGEMMDWHMNTGQKVIEDQIRDLGDYCYQQLGRLQGLKTISPQDSELRCAMISAIVLNKSNRGVYEYLKTKDIIVKVLPKYNALRFSTHLFNSTEDIDKLIEELKRFL